MKILRKTKAALIAGLLLALAISALFIIVSGADGDNEIWVNPSDTHITIGDSPWVSFNLSIDTAVNSIGLDNVTYEPAGRMTGTGTPSQGDVLTGGLDVFWNTTDWSANSDGYASPLCYWARDAVTNNTDGEIVNTTFNANECGQVWINITEGGTSNGSTDVPTIFHNVSIYIHPEAISGQSATGNDSSTIWLQWTKGNGGSNTTIIAKQGSLPSGYSDGVEIYNGTNTQTEHRVGASEHWYYRFYSWNATVDLLSLTNVTADASSLSGAISITNFQKSHTDRHCVDWQNISVDVVNGTEVFLNVTCADSTVLSINVTQNNSGDSYWCNCTWDNGASPGGSPYGWPEDGNGTYATKIYVIGEAGSDESSSTNFYIYPNADVTMNNQTSAADLSQIVGSNWMDSGSNRFCVEDTNGNGQVSAADLSYVVNADNWMWSGSV